jgi:uncharacterized membrane protein YedE/YeeE
MSTLMLSAASGGIFGAALTASGVYLPSIILQQLQLKDWHMLETFVTASACSALIVAAARRSQYAELPCRKDSSYGWFSKYDANLIGGAMQGIGMALTGACPGTVLVQLALGYKSARNIAIGCVLGGIAFVNFGQRLRRSQQDGSSNGGSASHCVHEKIGLSASSMILTYETLCILILVAASYLAPTRDHWLNPIVGGILIGLAQASSVLFTRKTLGVSNAWEDVGKGFWSFARGTPGPTATSLVFATGIMAGAKLISQHIPTSPEASAITTPTAAVLGGFVSIFGARIAGGCTSGHGISGMATLGLSSFITVASMFSAGVPAALAMR